MQQNRYVTVHSTIYSTLRMVVIGSVSVALSSRIKSSDITLPPFLLDSQPLTCNKKHRSPPLGLDTDPLSWRSCPRSVPEMQKKVDYCTFKIYSTLHMDLGTDLFVIVSVSVALSSRIKSSDITLPPFPVRLAAFNL